MLTTNITGNNPPNNPPIQERNQHAQEEDDDASTPDPALDTLNDDMSMEEDGPVQGDDASSMEDASVDSSQQSVDSAYNPKAPVHRETLEQFTGYKHGGDGACGPLPPEFRAAIELMSILDQEGAPTSAHGKLMDWHVKHSVCPECKAPTQEKVTDKALLKRLRERYNMQDLKPYKVRTYLPHARIYLDVPCHDAAAMIRDLLTDPRITDDDYLFFEDDPTAPPLPTTNGCI